MEINEYQELAMRTNPHKATERLLGNMLTCDMNIYYSKI